jgi:TIR domain
VALSYVGEPFEYDIFVSYAWAEAETKTNLLRNWSTYVAEHLKDLLALAFNVEEGAEIRVCFDKDELVSGQPLTQTLREKVQRSALLLVLMSPFYPKKGGWCLEELEWFFQQADQDGRGQEHCVVLRIQPLSDDAWPERLRDARGKPVLFRDFFDRKQSCRSASITLAHRNLP